VAIQADTTDVPAYTSVINVLNYSVVVIPVTTANREVDKQFSSDWTHWEANDFDERNWSAYDKEVYHGAPVGLQLVARKFEEEKILGIAQIVTAVLKARGVDQMQL
jgi:amidase